METNNHFNFTGLSSAPAASGPKPTPASGDSPFAHGSPLSFPPQGKSLNGGMNVNGFSTVSHASTSGTFAPSSPPAGTPPPPPLRLPLGLRAFPLNGVAGGSRPASPGHGTNLRGAGQEFWGNGTPGPMGLNFDSQELYDSFHDQSFELMPNGPAGFYTAAQPSPMLGSGSQPFSLPPDEPGAGDGDADAAAKELPPAITENGGGLVGSLELEEAQPDLKICGYNGSVPGAVPLGQEGPVLPPGVGSGCLGDTSPIAPRLEDTPILSEDPLEPFESLARDPGTGDLYAMDDSQLVTDKSPLEEPPDLRCASPPLHAASPFSLLPTSPPPAPLLAGPASPPPPARVDLNGSGHAGLEELDPPLGPESPALSVEEEEEEEEAADSCPETSAVPEAESEEAAPLSTAAAGDVPRRRIATQEEVRFPLQHGWRREVRIKKGNHRWQGETWYYGPCGKRMKQFPEVIKYLSRNVVQDVRREHFSFSPRMPVGDFYEERDTPEGLQWVKLSPEEIPSRIQAITGKRGRPRNAEKAKPKEPPAAKRGRGRPPKVKMVDLLSKTDARLLKRLEAQEVLSDEDKLKMSKIKKKMRRKAKNKQKQEAKAPRAKEAKKKSKAKEKKSKPEKGKDKARPKEKKGKGPRKADKGLVAQRRLEERRRQQLILEEMKKPTEDMCLGDHQPLPAFSRIPGLILPSRAFSNCLTVVEFLQSYGKVLGFDPAKDVPSLCALQEGLLGVGDSAGEVQDLLVRLLQAALYDPGLPPYCQSLKILGEKVSEISLNRDTVSEILRCFLTAYGAGEDLCEGLRTKPFQALPPEKKAAILGFLVNELNSSALIINEIDKTLENMSNYRKNKWIIEGRLRRLKVALAKKTGRPESDITGLEDGRRRRSSRLTEETGLEMEEEEETRGRKSRREEEADTSASSVPELERQIEKLAKRQMFFRKKLLHSSQTLRAASLGQDRYRRRYWVLPHLGGIFVEGAEVADPAAQEPPEEKASPHVSPVKEEPVDVPVPSRTNCTASRSRGRPRKSKEELSQHCGPRPPPVNGVLEESVPLGQSQHDLSQSAFLSWLSQTQSSLLKGSVLTPDSSPGKGDTGLPPLEAPSDPTEEEEEEEEESAPEAAEKRGPWFNLLPRTPCDDRAPLAISSAEPSPRATAQPRGQPRGDLPKGSARQLNGLPADDPAAPLLASTPVHAGARAHGACPRSRGSLEKLQDLPGQPKRRGRPPTKFFKQIEQKYLTQLTEQPVPPGERGPGGAGAATAPGVVLSAVLPSRDAERLVVGAGPRGAGGGGSRAAPARHPGESAAQAPHQAQGVPAGDLPAQHHRPHLPPAPRGGRRRRVSGSPGPVVGDGESLRDRPLRAAVGGGAGAARADGRPADPGLDVPRPRLHAGRPAVLRAQGGAPGGHHGAQPAGRAAAAPGAHQPPGPGGAAAGGAGAERGAALPEGTALAAARGGGGKGGAERPRGAEPGPHRDCLRDHPPRADVASDAGAVPQRGPGLPLHLPAGEIHRLGEVGQQSDLPGVPARGRRRAPAAVRRLRPRLPPLLPPAQDDGGARGRLVLLRLRLPGGGVPGPRLAPARQETETGASLCGERRRGGGEPAAPAGLAPPGGAAPRAPLHQRGAVPAKRRGATLRGPPSDLTFCEIILMEMESHEDAWPFLEPVNPRLVPGYRKIIKNPMDFATMRTRLLRGGYSSSEEFAADAMLVFDNCQTFNEDDSAVGKAGHAMRKFFESRWEEFYQGKHATNP
ncbi:unnamed protein product [Bubo scandiacus]